MKRAEADRRFRDRCAEALGRCLRIRRMAPPRPITDRAALDPILGGAASKAVLAEIDAAHRARRSAMS